MGLDVSAYSKLVKLDCVFDKHGEPQTEESYVQVCINDDFPGRADEFEHRAVYAYAEGIDGWSGGYGRYNGWRNTLAKIAGWPLGSYDSFGVARPTHCEKCWAGEAGPFSELINFSDCEGTIGTAVSAKLLADFIAYDDKAQAEGEDFYRPYQQWRACFALASDGGCVTFH